MNDIKEILQNSNLDNFIIEEIISNLKKDERVPDNDLEISLIEKQIQNTDDWREKAKLRAKIISLNINV